MSRRIIFPTILFLYATGLFAQSASLELRKLQFAEMAVEALYVDSVDEKKLVESAIRGMLRELDPHSEYATAEEVQRMNEPLTGNFEGIGVQFTLLEDTMLVIQTISGGPSEKVGIRAGDRIIAVNDTAIAGVKMSQDEIMSRLRGAKGSKVNLRVVRRSVEKPLLFTVVRDKIPIHSLDAAYLIRPHIGYIRLNRFAATTHEEFCEALRQLIQAGARDLILDLQGNGGGYLQAATALANEVLEDNELIVYIEGRRTGRQNYNARGNGMFRTGKLAVLIDEYSASASEIVAGAVQDWDRGLIIGRRSFGKGLVQRPIDLPDGSMIRLTTARYYTPSGRCIQKPYTANDEQGYENELNERYLHGELLYADSIQMPTGDSLKYETRKLHRTVYGGGGIMPDIFVPLDTTTVYTRYHRAIVNQGVLLKAVDHYIEMNRAEMEIRYRDFDKYYTEFTVDDDLLEYLRSEADKAGIPFDEAQYIKALPLIRLQLKAYIARDFWDMNAFFRIFNETDNTVLRAVAALSDEK
ncbi:MAG: S41 family peptidase [Prevotellaceae bacterium]|jgi:carboxyl-terminal processing protease|nr:S41 family peptidase [Prevotellaceae bacterium]